MYSSWRSLEAEIASLVRGKKAAMEYSPGDAVPVVDRVPAGVIEMVRAAGATVVTSADLVTRFFAVWTAAQLASHRRVGGDHRAHREGGVRPRRRERAERHAACGVSADGLDPKASSRRTGCSPITGRTFRRPKTRRTRTTSRRAAAPRVCRAGDCDADRSLGDGTERHLRGPDLDGVDRCAVAETATRLEHRARRARRGDRAAARTHRTAGTPVRGAEADDAARGVIDRAGFGAAFHASHRPLDRRARASRIGPESRQPRDARGALAHSRRRILDRARRVSPRGVRRAHRGERVRSVNCVTQLITGPDRWKSQPGAVLTLSADSCEFPDRSAASSASSPPRCSSSAGSSAAEYSLLPPKQRARSRRRDGCSPSGRSAAFVALAGALTYAELGAMMPEAGGGYVYVREAFGRLPAFLLGWMTLLMIASGAIAAVAMGFAGYLERFVPDRRRRRTDRRGGDHDRRADDHELPRREAGDRDGEHLHDLKIAALGALIVVGLALHPGAPPVVVDAGVAPPLANGIAAAFVAVLFTIGGWQQTNMVAGEIRDPGRTLPRALVGRNRDRDRRVSRRERRLPEDARARRARREHRRRRRYGGPSRRPGGRDRHHHRGDALDFRLRERRAAHQCARALRARPGRRISPKRGQGAPAVRIAARRAA